MSRRTAIIFQFFLLFGIIIMNEAKAQELLSKQRSTLSMGGASKIYTSNGKQYIVQQSIGQASVINSYQANGFVLRQGFIQPLMGTTGTAKRNNNLQASVSPNPFSNTIRISFSEEISDNLYVTVCSLHGKTLFSKSFQKSQELTITLNHLSTGFYIIRVNSGSKYFVSKIIKD